MFGSNFRTDSIPRLTTYAQARARYDKAPIPRGWVKAEGGTRILAERTNKNKLIHTEPGKVMCRLYSTDVVTYHEDNSVEITTWASRTTTEFADALLPYGLGVDMACQLGPVVWVGNRHSPDLRGYLVPDRIRLVPAGDTWTVHPDTPTPSFEHYSINQPVLRAALNAVGYPAFVDWFRARWALGWPKETARACDHDWRTGKPTYGMLTRGPTFRACADEVIAALKARDYAALPKLLAGASPHLPDEVRMCLIVDTPDAIKRTLIPHLTEHKQVYALRSAHRKWSSYYTATYEET